MPTVWISKRDYRRAAVKKTLAIGEAMRRAAVAKIERDAPLSQPQLEPVRKDHTTAHEQFGKCPQCDHEAPIEHFMHGMHKRDAGAALGRVADQLLAKYETASGVSKRQAEAQYLRDMSALHKAEVAAKMAKGVL
jgi:hypothetical protein